jgi:drug/metabolite transporter (DMT)-like permease
MSFYNTDETGRKKITAVDYAIIFAAVTIWGGSFASTKYALGQAGPMLVIWLRLLSGMPVLMVGAIAEKSLRMPTKEEFWPLLLMGFQGILFHQGIQSYAMETAGAANANWMMVASPALVALLGWIFLKERISVNGICGLLLSIAGVLLVIGFGTVRETSQTSGFGTLGDMIMLFSVFNWAVFLIISRKMLKTSLSPGFVIFWEMFFALILCTPLTIAAGCDFSVIPSFTWQTWSAILFLGVFSSAIAYLFWFRALSVFPVARVVIFQFFQPLSGAVVAHYLVGECFTYWLFIGGAMIISGVWLVNK